MAMAERSIVLTANVEFVVRKKGRILHHFRTHNTILDPARWGVAAQLLATPTLTKASVMAIGTGTPIATALGAEIARVAFQSVTLTQNVGSAVVQFVGFYDQGIGTSVPGPNIIEAAIFDSGSPAGMWMSVAFPSGPIQKDAGDTLTITWNLTLA